MPNAFAYPHPQSLPNVLKEAHNTMRATSVALRNAMLHRVLSDGGAGIGTTTSKVRSNATISYTINGEFKSKAATDDLWTLTGAVIPAGQKRTYLLLLDSAGAATVAASDTVLAAGTVTLPAWPADKAIVGSVTVSNGSGGNFTPGTTALNAASITTTYFDGVPAAMLPAAPTEDVES
jgi:hypothetical protein